jgi:hypothetical protein
MQARVTTDLGRCEQLWNAAMPDATIWDRWDLRACFQRAFERPVRFITVEDGGDLVGLLPLAWIEETGCYGIFPGETWRGRTWLEQNRIPARDARVLATLLAACPGNMELRYLAAPSGAGEVDEIGYLFSPARHEFNVDGWFAGMSGRHAKRLRREIAAVEGLGLRYRFDDLADIPRLVELNLAGFGDDSYFASSAFHRGFLDATAMLAARGWLRVTTILAGDRLAAVDVGCVYRNTYTILAGATHPDFRGIAKVINLHHLRRACDERLDEVDFLCGDFGWKERFHLQPRPLYRHAGAPPLARMPVAVATGSQRGQ